MRTESSDTTTTSLEELEGDKYKDLMGSEVSSPTMMADETDSLGLEKFSLDDKHSSKGTPKPRSLERIDTDVKKNNHEATGSPDGGEVDDEVQLMDSPVSDEEELRASPKRPRTRSRTPKHKPEIVDSPVSDLESSKIEAKEKRGDESEDVMVDSPISDDGSISIK